LNRPFWEGELSRRGSSSTIPFRPFVVRAGGVGGTHYLGAIYQHWVADSISMRMLLREWFRRLYDPARVDGRELHVPRGGFWRYFGPHRAGWHPVEGAIVALESMTQFATARRLDKAAGAQEVTCTLHRLPDGMIDQLVEYARRNRKLGMTFNDMLIAAVARAVDQYGAEPRRCSKDLAVGTIVDLRATSKEDMDHTFGMFLGFTALVVRGDLLPDRERLLRSIAAQNAHMKERRAAQVSMIRMAAGYMQGRFLSSEQLETFYRNYMPLSGGVSNVNMNRSWPAEYHPEPLLDYIRVAPTGPMVPVVIGATTIGKRFTFVLTRRNSLVDDEHARLLADAFIKELTARAKTG